MERTLVDKYYNIVTINNNYYKDKFNETIDSIFELHKDKKISNEEMGLLFKLVMYFEFKEKVENEKRLFIEGVGKRNNKNIDTLYVNLISKDFLYDK